ncbi:hypothetical protein ILUMI_07274 [Ignelater luminosus]|uniref:Protease inhibitor n=1 Tax=Ignelater luminosus TaxID=2038154 RepID=A0A8K0GBS1_IGNLU|nr:hypothetical protein ILUMI_07274 [Ignelater luminosus]
MKFVIFFGLYLFCVVSNVDECEEEKVIFKCVPGVLYRENDCNMCLCIKPRLGCTRKHCPSRINPRLRNCVVDSTWKRNCNQCWCVKKMGTVCTLKRCGQKNKPI